MENNPGDSSSESDITDPWSMVDRDSCGPDEIHGDNSGRDSISGEPSDGESLEVIDEVEQHEEFKDAGMETDCGSIHTESEINEELIQPLPSAVLKEKKYLHHPNTYLNNRLNVLLAISLAAVTGLGLGHFIGLQEECPVLSDSTASLLTKLQEENEMLRHKLDQLLSTNDYKDCVGWDCEPKSNLEKTDISYIHSGLKSEIQEQNLQLENYVKNKESTNQKELDFFENIVNLLQEDRNVDNEIFENFVDMKHRESADYAMLNKLVDGGDDHKSIIDMKVINKESRYPIHQNKEEKPLVIMENVDDMDINPTLNKEDKYVRIVEEQNLEEKPLLVLEEKVVANSERNSLIEEDKYNRIEEKDEKNSKINELFLDYENDNDIKLTNLNDVNSNIVLTDSVDNSIEPDNAQTSARPIDNIVFLYPSNKEDQMKILSHGEEIISEYLKKTSDNVYNEQNYIYPETMEKDSVKGTYLWEENDLQQIKSTLELLRIHFDNDISPDTGDVLSSTIKLASEYEQGLIKLQKTITDCKVKRSEFCIQFQKKMEVSISKLRDTSEELAEDIDEQMYKLLSKIARKLKKFKGNVQNKWCHLKNKFDDTNDWFQSSLFLDCKENKQHEHFSSKMYETSHENIIKDNIVQNQNPQNIINNFKNSNPGENENNVIKENMSDKIIKHEGDYVLQTNGEFNKHSKKHFQKKENKNNEYNRKTSCYERGNDKHCKEYENRKEYLKSQDKKREAKKNEKEHEKKYNKRSVTLNQSRSWPKFDSSSHNQKNISGEWILKMADGRAEQRKLNHKSDWLFDRADARKIRREKDHRADSWYFQRARDRENCRYSPNPEWCKTGPNYEWHQNKYERENEEKIHYGSRWSKKFIPRAFATAGKWMKDSFSKFENKFNYYHSHH